MKKLALVITLFTAIGMNAFAQGYVNFTAFGNNVYDDTYYPSIPAPGDVTVTFLWALVGTPDPLGAGTPTSGDPYLNLEYSDFVNTLSSMLTSGWNIAEDAGNGNAEADVAVNSSGIFQGGFGYNGGAPFRLAGSTGGDTYDFVVIGWNNQSGAETLEEGLTDSYAVGWSSAFTYATGANNTSPVNDFNSSGESPFGVAAFPVPEPTTIALAGLGGLSLLLVRRKS
jgi:hypothetical protein